MLRFVTLNNLQPSTEIVKQFMKMNKDNSQLGSIKSIYSHSFLSNTFEPKSVQNVKRPWFKQSHDHLYSSILHGKQFIDTYDPITKERYEYIVTPKSVHKNGILIPMTENTEFTVVIDPGILYRHITGNSGATTINVKIRENYEDEVEDKNKNEKNINILSVYNINEKTGEIEEIAEYNDTEPPNSTPYHQHMEALCRRWDSISFII